MTPPSLPVLDVPLAGRKLTPHQWQQIEKALADWKTEVLQAAKRHPARSYRLGVAQTEAFADLLAQLDHAAPAITSFGGVSPSMREAQAWSQTYTLRELDDALNIYIGRIKDALLHGLRGALNPTAVASLIYHATRDASINWRTIARTEMARANAAGRLAAIEAMGYDKVWSPPHIGACKWCKRVLEGHVFDLQQVKDATNYGRRRPAEWVPAAPLHPNCRHSWLPYDPDVYAAAQEQYRRMEAAGLTDEDRLDELFDSSGQLKPGVDPAVFDAAKLMDPYAEGLAAAIYKATRPPTPAARRRVRLPVLALERGLHQRTLDPDKVLAIIAARRRGEVMPPISVNASQGRYLVENGQHRMEAARLLGDDEILADVAENAPWDGDADVIREVVGKVHDPLRSSIDVDDPERLLDQAVAKSADLDALLERVESDVQVDPSSSRNLDPLLFDGGALRPEVGMAADVWWTHLVGSGWETWSQLLVPEHGPLEVRVNYPALRAARPEWKKLSDTDLHFALAAAARGARAAIAPGLPDDVHVWPHGPHDTGSAWDVAASAWTGEPPAAALKSVESALGPYSWTDTELGSAVLDPSSDAAYLARAREVLDVGKAAANAGVEHWITIHPHGEEEKGTPVLVRNGADGTMTVIGGAGGNLNMMRLDPKRRVDRDKDGKAKSASGGKRQVEEQLTDEEREAKEREREEQITAAREQLDRIKQARAEKDEQLRGFVRDELGIDLDDGELDHNARQKMLKKLRVSATRTLAYGPISRRDANEGATAEQTGADKDPNVGPAEGSADSSGESAGEARPPRPSVAMDEERARALLDHFLDLQHLSKQAAGHRRVIAGESQPSDALQIDHSEGADDEAREKRRNAAVEQAIRTDLARQLTEHADRELDGKGKYKTQFRRAFDQGGFDTIDAFSSTVLGQGLMTRETSKLLGVGGAAQLAAHELQRRAREEGLDLNAVQKALKDLTDARERAVNERGLARMQHALTRASQAAQEVAKSERGESLYTTTMARSIASEKVQEAKRGLGMMVGGLEAASALKVALDRRPGEKIKVGGFSNPAQIKELAAKAHVKIGNGDIIKVGAGNYTLAIEPERLAGLVQPEAVGDPEKRAKLTAIRNASDLDAAVQAARTGPGMSDTLDENQARAKLFLQEAGSAVLGFDPGVGKTHIAIATAMEKMHDAGQLPGDPNGKHKALIVVPTNMIGAWRDTIAAQGGGHSIATVDGSTPKQKQVAMTSGADFTIVSYESLKSRGMQKALREHHEAGGRAHSIVIADELQKAKTESSDNHQAVEKAVDAAREHHGDDAHFWGLSGTPIEKDVTDLHAMVRLAKRARGEDFADRAGYKGRFSKLGQDEHIARGDKVRQFRKGLDDALYRLSAQDAGNDLPEPDRAHHDVELDDDHKAALQSTVNGLNEQTAEANRVRDEGGKGQFPEFGGRTALINALYGREDSALARKVADNIESTGSFDFGGMDADHEDGNYKKGDHAGSYEHKHVVFGDNLTSRALFGTHPSGKGFDPEARGGLAGELRKRGIKVFVGHGQMGKGKNDASYKAFLAHKGKAVFVTNDKNNAGISLQFGDNKGAFQHGATHLHHFTRPVNNATIQQREARVLRKGAQAKVQYHTYSSNTPAEQRLQETLEKEARTQDLAANSDQQVAGEDTLFHHLKRRGADAPA